MKEMINHPQHYNSGQMEVIDMMSLLWGNDAVALFCYMNAFKYRMRAGLKEDATQDIKKALWYENKAKELETKID